MSDFLELILCGFHTLHPDPIRLHVLSMCPLLLQPPQNKIKFKTETKETNIQKQNERKKKEKCLIVETAVWKHSTL